MNTIRQRLARIDWPSVTEQLHARGYAHVPKVLSAAECRSLIALYDEPVRFRKVVTMERHAFGLGEYKYFAYPLPKPVQTIRAFVYPKLAPIANQWMEWLGGSTRYPKTLAQLRAHCGKRGQTKPTPLLLQYGQGGYNALHQDLYGDVFFPMQLVLCLSEPERDYTGGEFVMTQQVPRAQSKAIVLRPRRGDMILFTTHFRPIRGKRGYFRASMRHGVSEVHRGKRFAAGIIFHDARS